MDNKTIVDQIPPTKIADYVEALPNFSSSDFELGGYPMTPVKREVVEIDPPDRGTEEEELEADFQKVRENLSAVVGKTAEVVEDLLSLARSTESPRAYEVLGNTIKTLLDANKDLLDVHERKAKIKAHRPGKDEPAAVTNNTQNNVFVGSSSDILDMINKSRGIQ